jgi:SAM-dependent methyltransferase
MSSHKLRVDGADRASVRGVASAYNGAGMNYAAYADGDSDPRKLFSFDGLHAYPDKQVWNLLEAKLRALRAAGANAVSILDAGCGPGTWLRRLVLHARDLGFSSIRARGFDIAEVQIYAARRRAREFSDLPGVDLKFDVADILAGLPEPTATVDITLCLYSVLSHVAVRALPRALEELARVTRQHADDFRRFGRQGRRVQARLRT